MVWLGSNPNDKLNEVRWMPTRKASEVQPKDTIMALVWGEPKTGKNTFAIGKQNLIEPWPRPIHIINMDWGTDELLPHVDPGIKEQIYLHDVEIDKPVVDVNLAKRVVKDIYDGLLEAEESVKKANQGTIVIDTATYLKDVTMKVDMEDIIKVREAQGKELFGYDYSNYHARHRALVQHLKTLPCNVLFLAHSEVIWTAKGPTSEIKPSVWKHLKGLVQEEIHLTRTTIKYVGKDPVTKFEGTIVFSRHNNNVTEVMIENLSYPTLYAMLFGKGPTK